MAGSGDLLKKVQQAFTLFDYDNDGKITSKELGIVIRSVGLDPTEAQIKELGAIVNSQGDKVDAKGVEQLIQRHNMSTTTDELKDAFLIFDKSGNGTVSVNDLRHATTHLGECLRDEELDEVIREVDPDGIGEFHVDDIVRVLLKKAS